MFKPEMSEPEEAVPTLVARVVLAAQRPKPQPVLPVVKDGERPAVDLRVAPWCNKGGGAGFKINGQDVDGPPVEASFASFNEGLTFQGIGASGVAGSAYMKSRRVG